MEPAQSPTIPAVKRDRITLGKMQNPVRGFLHGSAAVAAVVGTVLITARAPTWPSRVALLAFGVGMIALYVTSSLYHSIPWRDVWKARMQRMDHSMIFLLIAGTQTPIAVIVLDGWWRVAMLSGVWGITLAGIGKQAFFPADSQRLSIILTLTLGWLSILILLPFAQHAGILAVALTAIGGIIYTIGVVIMVTDRPRLWPRVFSSHEVFHVCVVAGTAIHFTMTWRYVVPLAA